MAAGFKIAEAYAEIRTDSSKFVSGLGRARQSLQRFSGGMRRVAKQAARWGAVVGTALAAGIGLAGRAYATQERAENDLATALRFTGQEVEGNMARLKALASAIQDVTTYGDEGTLSMQAYATHLGVSADQLGAVTKTTIGLSKALKMDLQTALRYTALATQGEFTMLQRYIPALRETEDAQAKLALVMEMGARGFEAAQADTKTLGGTYSQLKNILGDVMEKIGQGFAPMLKGLAEWLKENAKLVGKLTGQIGAWVTQTGIIQKVATKALNLIWRGALKAADGLWVMKAGFLEARAAVAQFAAWAMSHMADVVRTTYDVARAIAWMSPAAKLALHMIDFEGFADSTDKAAAATRRLAGAWKKASAGHMASQPYSERITDGLQTLRREIEATEAARKDALKNEDTPLKLKGDAAEKERLRLAEEAAKRLLKWRRKLAGGYLEYRDAVKASNKEMKEEEEARRRQQMGQFIGLKQAWRRIQSATLRVEPPKAPEKLMSLEEWAKKEVDRLTGIEEGVNKMVKILGRAEIVPAVVGA